MNLFVAGLEMSAIGFTVTMVTLLMLATILVAFTKVFQGEQKGRGKGGTAAPQKISQQAKPAVQARVETGSAEKMLRPEIVAAAFGALRYAFEKRPQGFPAVAKIQGENSQRDTWAQAGRTRLINLRQDFVSYKRGKFR